jgi:hypothetical protein
MGCSALQKQAGFKDRTPSLTFLSHVENVNFFKFQPSAMFPFFVFAKVVSLKDVHPLKIYSSIKLHGPALTGASLASSSQVLTSVILDWLQLRHYKLRCRGNLQWHDFHTEFHKSLLIVSEVDWGTDRQRGW